MRRLGRGDKPRGKALVLPAKYVHEELFVSATTPGPQQPERGIRAEQVAVRSDPAQLAELVALVDAGELTIDIAQQLPRYHAERNTPPSCSSRHLRWRQTRHVVLAACLSPVPEQLATASSAAAVLTAIRIRMRER